MKRLNYILAAALCALIISSCSKEEKEIPSSEEIAQEDAQMEAIMDVISGQIENITFDEIEAAYPRPSQLKSSGEDVRYPVKTVEYPASPAKWPRIITIDYGPENIELEVRKRDIASLRGKVIIKKTAQYRKKGSTRTVSFEKFYFNDSKIVGSKVYTNMGVNDNNNLVFKWVVNLKASDEDHFWRKRKVRKERELVVGADTKEWKDNEFLITGEVNGSNSKKWSYTRTIIEPLYRYSTYRFPVKGIVKVENSNKTFTIDYGTGEKDNTADIYSSEGEFIKTITLGKKK